MGITLIMRPSQGFGEQGNKGKFFRGTGEQRPKNKGEQGTQEIFGNREHRKSRFYFWGTRPLFSRGTGTLPGRASIITCIDSLTTPNSTSYHKLEEKLKCYKQLEHSLGQKCVLRYVL